VPYSAYLFYKYAEHVGQPYAPDAWGEALTPAQLVAQARRMIDQYGFQSIKLKAGAATEQEAAGILALAEAFPGTPLRIDPNGNWTVETSLKIVQQLRGVLEYYEDPAPGLDGMAAVARECDVPLATNMVVTDFAEFRRNADMGCPVKIVLSDHHYWGGLRATAPVHAVPHLRPGPVHAQQLPSGREPGGHDASVRQRAPADLCLRHPLSVAGRGGRRRRPPAVRAGQPARAHHARPGRDPGPRGLARLHDNYLHCGIRNRDDLGQMRKYDPEFTGKQPRF
jgi:glucarate dehydratase